LKVFIETKDKAGLKTYNKKVFYSFELKVGSREFDEDELVSAKL
jgi:hypothetical protein